MGSCRSGLVPRVIACVLWACSGSNGDELEGPDGGRQGRADSGQGGVDPGRDARVSGDGDDDAGDSGTPQTLAVSLTAVSPPEDPQQLLRAQVEGKDIASV